MSQKGKKRKRQSAKRQGLCGLCRSNEKEYKALLITFISLIGVVVCLVIVIVLLNVFKSTTLNSSYPSLELAESVCTKYNGRLEKTVGTQYYRYQDERYFCIGNKNGTWSLLSNGSQFSISFFEDDKKDEIWSLVRSAISNSEGSGDVSGYVVLDDSDDYIKAYATVAGLARGYIVAYGNAVASISVYSDSVAEEMIKELGFPSGRRASDYKE